ncbi:MAG: carbonic anhydrase family protein [Alphaproteobacteria bacterium]|nr:carbonic anhydrase family protein [Alphaproteobacteria bacterium]
MNPIIKSVALSVAALALATAAHAETVKQGSDDGAVKTAATESHGKPTGQATAKKESRGKASKSAHGGASWTYSGSNGPDSWGSVSAKFAACGDGTTQSPINLTAAHAAGNSAGNIDFAYQPTQLRIVNNGHTVQVNYSGGSTMTVEGETFDLLQFHFHAPSEHAIDGKLADMEMHMVHRNAAGELGVVGVLMNIGAENLALGEIWQHMPREATPERLKNRNVVNARDFLPHNANYYRYMGSLTTPPCSEGVNWFVMADPIEVSREQVEQFAGVFGATNRPVQEVNNRLVLAPYATN